jgi:hypothetical protein
MYSDALFLLAMALADKALFGYKTFADIQRQKIPAGDDEMELKWKKSFLLRPILRKCLLSGGIGDEPMPKSAFVSIFNKTYKNAGYSGGASVHAIRRALGKKVDGK